MLSVSVSALADQDCHQSIVLQCTLRGSELCCVVSAELPSGDRPDFDMEVYGRNGRYGQGQGRRISDASLRVFDISHVPVLVGTPSPGGVDLRSRTKQQRNHIKVRPAEQPERDAE